MRPATDILAIIEQEARRLDRIRVEDSGRLPSTARLAALMDVIADTVFYECFHTDEHEDDAVRQRLLSIFTETEAVLELMVAPEKARAVATAFVSYMHGIKRKLLTDIKAIMDKDPAVDSIHEVIASYPAVKALLHYRTANALHRLGMPVVPRMITELAHSTTGIDIHPAATIGDYFAIDHGTGVVVGETCIIGSHVTLYQGVTLGAKAFTYDADGLPMAVPRHPIIEDNVTVYSNASILGRITVGHDSVIGGNVWLTHSVEPWSHVSQSSCSHK